MLKRFVASFYFFLARIFLRRGYAVGQLLQNKGIMLLTEKKKK